MAFFKIVIGYTGSQVVDVVKTDIPGKKLQYPGEFIIGRTLHGNGLVIPVFSTFSYHILELMLYVKQPDP